MEKKLLATLQGTIVKGKGAGHRHGMPTANLDVQDQLLPKHGVYGGLAFVEGNCYQCITNIGLRPSDDDSQKVTVESLLLDFSGDLYGKTMRLELYFFLREIRKFAGGLDEVRIQLLKDGQLTKQLFEQSQKEGTQM